MYLLTNPLTNIAGVYQITIDRVAFDTGYDERTLRPMFERFTVSKKAYYLDENWIILPTWPKHQKWKVRSKIKTGIERCLEELPYNVFSALKDIGYAYPIDTLSIGYAYPPNYSDTDTEEIQTQKGDVDPNPNPKSDDDEWEQVTTGDSGEDSDSLTSQFHDKIKGGPS